VAFVVRTTTAVRDQVAAIETGSLGPLVGSRASNRLTDVEGS
jgi:hypothetical protein